MKKLIFIALIMQCGISNADTQPERDYYQQQEILNQQQMIRNQWAEQAQEQQNEWMRQQQEQQYQQRQDYLDYERTGADRY